MNSGGIKLPSASIGQAHVVRQELLCRAAAAARPEEGTGCPTRSGLLLWNFLEKHHGRNRAVKEDQRHRCAVPVLITHVAYAPAASR